MFNRMRIPCIYCGEYIGRYRIHEHMHGIHKENKCANPMFNLLHGKTIDSIIEYINDNGCLLNRYKDKVKNSNKRNIKFEISLKEYSQLIYCSGLKVSDIGYSTGNYILVKIDPDKPFIMENARFITRKEYHYRGIREKGKCSDFKTGSGKIQESVPYRDEIDDDGKLYRRYSNKRYNAKAEGIGFELTFAQYCDLMREAGLKSSDLGYTGKKYVLARYGDVGPYSKTNCRFITQKENMDECASHTLYNGKPKNSLRSPYMTYHKNLEEGTAKDYIIIDIHEAPTDDDLLSAKLNGVCAKCGKPISVNSQNSSGLCSVCYNLYTKRNKCMPSRNDLKELIRNTSFEEIGRKYNISGKAIVKWCIKYSLPYKRKDINSFTDDAWCVI